MKPLIVLLFFVLTLPLCSQTKIWETASSTKTDYLAFSKDGSSLATLYKGSLTIWQTDSGSYSKKVEIYANSNPVFSNNNDTVYCLGLIGKVNGLYVIPLNEDSVYFRPLKEFQPFLNGGLFTVNPSFRFLMTTKDSNRLIFGYSYKIISIDPSEFIRGRVGIINLDGAQTSEVTHDAISLSTVNTFNNYLITTGKSHDAQYRTDPKDLPYLIVTSLNTGKNVYTTPIEYNTIAVCRDTNYFIANQALFHIPSHDFIRSLTPNGIGNFNSCSDNQDFYIVINNDTIDFVRYDRDTASFRLYCKGKINKCQLNSNSNRIAVVTNDTIISIYNIPKFVEQAALTPDFSSDYKVPYKGGPINFRNNSYITDSKYNLLWDFGDGDTSSSLHPVHFYKLPGTYTVSLTITTQSGEKSTIVKKMYVIYDDVPKPVGSVWAKRYTNAGITALSFISDNIIFAGTNDGSIYSINESGFFGKNFLSNYKVSYSFARNTGYSITETLHFKKIVYHKKNQDVYVMGVPKGISAVAYLLKFSINDSALLKSVDLGLPGYDFGNLSSGAVFYENNSDGGLASLSLSSDSSFLFYSNYGSASYSFDTHYPPNNIFTGQSKGNYVGVLKTDTDSILYDNGRSPWISNSGGYPNPHFLKTALPLCMVNVYSMQGGLQFNTNSYFVIASNKVNWIHNYTFDFISSFPTKGTTLRHSPDRYHSFTNDAIWSFADTMKIDSLPLLSAQTFEPFPDGVHLLVMYPKSDTIAVFNLQTKSFVHYFKANNTVSSIAISQDGSKVVIGDLSGIVAMWEVPTLPIIKSMGFEAPFGKAPLSKTDTVQFFNTSIPVNSKCRYEWDFGDGTRSTDQYPKHVYLNSGKYTVTLRSICPSETGGDSTTEAIVKNNYITISDKVGTYDENFFRENSIMQITPNPVIGEGHIAINLPHSEKYSIHIFNILGQEVCVKGNLEDSYTKFPIPSLPNGIYHCILQLGSGKIISQNFIVKE